MDRQTLPYRNTTGVKDELKLHHHRCPNIETKETTFTRRLVSVSMRFPQVTFDTSKHLSESALKRRSLERLKLQELERQREEQKRREKEEEERRKEEERYDGL